MEAVTKPAGLIYFLLLKWHLGNNVIKTLLSEPLSDYQSWGVMSLFVLKWSRLLEVILGRFEHGTFGFIQPDLFQFLPTQTIIGTQADFIHLIAHLPTFHLLKKKIQSTSFSPTSIQPVEEAELD